MGAAISWLGIARKACALKIRGPQQKAGVKAISFDNVIWPQKLPSCHNPYLYQMSLFQTFGENAKKKKVTFSSNLPFGTNIGGG